MRRDSEAGGIHSPESCLGKVFLNLIKLEKSLNQAQHLLPHREYQKANIYLNVIPLLSIEYTVNSFFTHYWQNSVFRMPFVRNDGILG